MQGCNLFGLACLERDNTLYTIDHHRGSEEHQPGEGYHDEELFDLSLIRWTLFQVSKMRWPDSRKM